MSHIKIGRDGRVPKKLGPIEVHGGMYHLRNGQLIGGVSKTAVGNVLDDAKFVATPTVEKKLAPVDINPGCRSRRNDPLN
jgi:hypothetical protein